MRNQYKFIALIAAGGTLEFYDFTIYGLFAPYISHHFFANADRSIELINAFAVFALGYLARPLGGVVFGQIGDKYGRKLALGLSVFLMALATLFMGLLPTYQSIGAVAPLVLILLRLVQGFSVGGEIPGASVFTLEHVSPSRYGLAFGLVFMCITFGNTLGALVGSLLTHILDEEQMQLWGWRLPFILGFVLSLVSYMIRKKALETPVFKAMQAAKTLQHAPFRALLKLPCMQLVNAFLLTAFSGAISSFFLFLPSFLVHMLKIQVSQAFLVNVFAFLSFGLFTAFFGFLSDYVKREKLIKTGTLLLLLFIWPLLHGLEIFNGSLLFISILGLGALGGMINGNYMILIAKSFPADLRYSAVGLCFGLGIASFGGLAPMSFTMLYQYFMSAEAPALYLIICAALTLFAAMAHEKKEQAYQSDTKSNKRAAISY